MSLRSAGWKAALLGVLFASLNAAPSGHAKPTPGPPPTPLAQHTTVKGVGGQSTLIQVPRPLKVPDHGDEHFRIESSSHVSGVVLISRSSKDPSPFLIGWTQWSFCDEPPCQASDVWHHTVVSNWKTRMRADKGWIIPAGIYELRLIGEGPVSTRLSFPGLSGSQEIRPSEPFASHINRYAAPMDQATTETDSKAWLVSASNSEIGTGVGVFGRCYLRVEPYGPDRLPNERRDFTCGGGQIFGIESRPSQVTAWSLSSRLPPGKWESVVVAGGVGDPDGARFLDLWIEY